jgi:drug/metabolite transporter (DMT)-like permease
VAIGLVCALAAAVLYGVAAVLQADSARRAPRAIGLDARVLIRTLRYPSAVLALALLLLGFGLHLAAVRRLPLFLAQAGIAVSLVVSALMAFVIFSERLSRVEWGSVGALFVGLTLLTSAAGRIGTEHVAWLSWVLFGGVVVIAVLAWPVSRARTILSAAALGMLSGFAYAAVGIAGRLLPGWTVGDLAGSTTTYVLLVSGLIAFLLYTLALQRGGVMVATTPLIVAQTVTPAVVGVLLLGDRVRPGWSAAGAVGFTLTVTAATVLVRLEDVAARRAPRRARENGPSALGWTVRSLWRRCRQAR